jgi:SAM-dependent methyltransferase
MTHTQRRRAESFGEDAQLYERARPGYPPELVQELAGGAALDVLDVGCGTGKAARAFAAAGCRVLGVEVDERMAEVARASGLDVELARFEAWEPSGRSFDLVVSGQAWHWLDPAVAPARAAEVLRAGGRLAPFWNYRDPSADAGETSAMSDVYRREAPELLHHGGSQGAFDYDAQTARHAAEIEACGRYAPCRVTRYHWSETFTTERWLDRLATQSEHRILEPGARARLFAGLREVLEERGGLIEVSYTTHCIVAERR